MHRTRIRVKRPPDFGAVFLGVIRGATEAAGKAFILGKCELFHAVGGAVAQLATFAAPHSRRTRKVPMLEAAAELAGRVRTIGGCVSLPPTKQAHVGWIAG
jgi:hypothetical protein